MSSDLKVLIVEDEEAHAELLSRAFEDAATGEVFVVPTLAEANAVLETSDVEFDLVITDLRLPDGVGTSLIDDEQRHVPVVIMTSQGDERAAVDAIKQGAYDYVVKSVVAFEEMPRTALRVKREWRHAQEEEQLRRRLAENERLAGIGTAAAMLAHEIANPLNSMSLSAQLIERRLSKIDGDVSQIRDVVSTCRTEIGRLSSLLAEFRSLSRQQDVQLRPVDVTKLFGRVAQAYGPAFEAAGVDLSIDVTDEPLVVLANEEKLTQVVVNLCKNAMEAMPDGGAIELAGIADGDMAILRVKDDGPGLPDDLDVFEPFVTTKSEGTGLGLAVVAQILAAHGGRASCEPVPDGGACFVLELQLADSMPV